MIRLGFIGDTSFTGAYTDCQHFNNSTAINSLKIALHKNDFNIANLEGPLTHSPFKKAVGVCIKSDPKHIHTLSQFKINIINLSNNHIMDSGVEGLVDTIKHLSINNFSYFGAGLHLFEALNHLSISKNNVNIALLGICHRENMTASHNTPGILTTQYNSLIRSYIKKLKASHDWVVISYHGGEEYTFVPMPSRVSLLNKYKQWGADIIIAHHPHVVQGYLLTNTNAIFYSLGNFIFDIPQHYSFDGTDESVIINIEFQKRSFRFVPLFTKMDRIRGNLYQLDFNSKFHDLNSNNLSKDWQKDCYRIVFNRPSTLNIDTNPTAAAISSSSCSISKILKYVFYPRSYITLFRIIFRSPNFRPVFIAALIFALRFTFSKIDSDFNIKND